MNYRNTPFLRILLPFAIGILLADTFPLFFKGYAWVLLCMVSAITLLSAGWKYTFPYRWVFGLIAQTTLLLAGYCYTEQYNEMSKVDHFSQFVVADSVAVFEGLVTDMPVPGEHNKVRLALENIQGKDGLPRQCSGNILLFVREDTLNQPIHYGDRIIAEARISLVKPPANPDAFDYRNYLHHQGIHHNAYLKRENITVIARNQGSIIWEKAFQYRDNLLAVLKRYFPGNDEYAVASALLVGYKEDLSDEIKLAYAETGSMHALAVSGTHVGLLYMGLLFMFERLPLYGRKGRLIETLLALLAIWAFTLLTGATASVLRASVMFSTYLVGKMVFRQATVWNVLSASAFGLLVYNPYFLFDAGFLLSYAAVVGMAFFYPLFYKVSPVMKYKWMDEGWKVFLVGVSAQIGTLPLSLFYFHQFPCYFWLSGWVVVSGGAIFLWAGTLLIILDFTIPHVAGWLGYGLNGMLWLMNKIIAVIQHLPGSIISGIWISGLGAVVLYCIIAAIGAAITLRKTKSLILGIGGFACLMTAGAFVNMEQTLQKEICIYQVGKARLIDIFDGHQRFTFSENTTPKQENFAAQAHRWASGVEHKVGDGLSFNRDTVVDQVKYSNNIIHFNNIKIAIVDTVKTGNMSRDPTAVSALLISHSPNLTLKECLEKYPSETVIIDPTNSWKKVEHWKLEATALGVTVWDIRECGAWRWTN